MNVIGMAGYLSGGLLLENSKHPENPQADYYQAGHHQMVASAKVTKLLHEIDHDVKIGCMIVRMENYPNTPNHNDVLASIKSD